MTKDSDKGAAHWPADKVKRWPIDLLIPYARNARTHSPESIAKIAASIVEWGWTIPVLIDEAGTLIAGHGRVLAAQKLGLTEAPAMVAAGWSDAKKAAYRLADNKLALAADWDADLLKMELADLRELDFNLDLTGFEPTEIADLLAFEPAPVEPAAPPPGMGSPVIQFNIVFDAADQQDLWFGFLRRLKAVYPDEETLGARLARYLTEGAPSGEA